MPEGRVFENLVTEFENERGQKFVSFDIRDKLSETIIAKEIARSVAVDVLAWEKATSQLPDNLALKHGIKAILKMAKKEESRVSANDSGSESDGLQDE